MLCEKCGKENPDGAERCESCAEKLAAESKASAPPKERPRSGPRNSWELGPCCMASGLIAVLIIASIAAVLFQMFAQGREMGRKSTCQSNMKRLANSMNMYVSDWNGVYPSSAAGPYGKHWSAAADETFRRKLGYPPSERAKGQFLGTWPEVLDPYIGRIRYRRDDNPLFCPSDRDNRRREPNGEVSYVVKKAFHMAWWGKGTLRGTARRDSDFKYPSDQILLYERRGWHFGDAGKGDMSKGTGVSWVTLNMAFMDGHVSWERIPADDPRNSEHGKPTRVEPDFYNTIVKTGKRITKPGATDPRVYGDTLD